MSITRLGEDSMSCQMLGAIVEVRENRPPGHATRPRHSVRYGIKSKGYLASRSLRQNRYSTSQPCLRSPVSRLALFAPTKFCVSAVRYYAFRPTVPSGQLRLPENLCSKSGTTWASQDALCRPARTHGIIADTSYFRTPRTLHENNKTHPLTPGVSPKMNRIEPKITQGIEHRPFLVAQWEWFARTFSAKHS